MSAINYAPFHNRLNLSEETMEQIKQIGDKEVAVLEQIRDSNTILLQQLVERDHDKETRLRKLEKLMYIATGAVGVLSLAVQLLFQLWLQAKKG